MGCLPFAAYHVNPSSYDYSAEGVALKELLKLSGPRDLAFRDLTQLLWLQSDGDFESLMSVSPGDLARSLGESFSLKRVVLELTADPITPQPSNWPQWLQTLPQNKSYIFGGARSE